MELSSETKKDIIDELIVTLNGHLDGSRKNIVAQCPFCHHRGEKYGIYIGPESKYKVFGSSNCFHCNRRYRTLEDTLKALDREDLLPKETASLDDDITDELNLFEDDVDDDLEKIEMPKGYKRCFKNRYLKSRGFTADDYEYFPCGTTRGINHKYDDYVLLEIHDNKKLVGFVGRHIWSKHDIDEYNASHRFQIRRYNNSTDNGFGKLLYNIDAVKELETESVILCEGCFDVIALTRKLNLYDYPAIVPVATFGKKISEVQIYKLQNKGIKTVILGYDADAKDTTSEIAIQLDKYFDVYIADLSMAEGKDWDEMSDWAIYDIFDKGLKTVREFNLE